MAQEKVNKFFEEAIREGTNLFDLERVVVLTLDKEGLGIHSNGDAAETEAIVTALHNTFQHTKAKEVDSTQMELPLDS